MEEICDHFAGDWQIVRVHGYSDAEPDTGEPARLAFWEDGTGELSCAGVSVIIDVEYGETLEGLSAITFEGRRTAGEKRSAVSGLGAIRKRGGLAGSVTIGGPLAPGIRPLPATRLPAAAERCPCPARPPAAQAPP